MKTCSDCGEVKSLTDFVPKASCKDGYEPRCRKCRAIKFNKSKPDRVAAIIYERQLQHSIYRGHPAPTYSLYQLIVWMDAQPNMLPIWNAYVASGYDTQLRPSVDRIDDSKPYDLKNIQLMTWRENRLKGAAGKKAGTVNANQRPVAAYNLDGSHHQDFISTIEAARSVNGRTWGIITVADGKPVTDGRGKTYQPKTYKGFTWRWL